ncbi:MAG: protein-glutamate O-methyltransferase CheR [Acidobacteriia bacterium]|nr:protein-glutamate O-methyltransferase CheR [Terriglobia bacterium]
MHLISSPMESSAGSALVRIRDLVYRVAGIFQPDNRLNFLQERCSRRMKAVGVPSLRGYLERLTAHPDRELELRQLLNEITVGETCFFRNQPQIEAVRRVVLPCLLEAKKILPFRNLRIWSAGCSTGEEPYTLAILLLEESLGMLKNCKTEVIATDLNDRSLARAQAGVYGQYALRNVSPAILQKYFTPLGDQFQLCDEVKAKVTFRQLNLLDDSKMVFMKAIDVIFCCNVLIYFDGASKRRVIQHFLNNVNPGGYFFLGYSESLFGVNDDFRLVHFPGSTGYHKPTRNGLVK